MELIIYNETTSLLEPLKTDVRRCKFLIKLPTEPLPEAGENGRRMEAAINSRGTKQQLCISAHTERNLFRWLYFPSFHLFQSMEGKQKYSFVVRKKIIYKKKYIFKKSWLIRMA